MRTHRALLMLVALPFAGVAHANVPDGFFDQMIVFGDSFNDNGNVRALTTGSFTTQVRPASPYYDGAAAPFGRFTNGPGVDANTTGTTASSYEGLWHENLADTLGISRANPVQGFTNGTNYATGGATTGSPLFNAWSFPHPDIGEQVTAYTNGSTPVGSNPLVVMSSGLNEMVRAMQDRSFGVPVNFSDLAATSAANIEDQIAQIHLSPTRGSDWFLVSNLPPVTLLPDITEYSTFSQTILDDMDTAVAEYNTAIDAMAVGLESAFPDLNVVVLDTHAFTLDKLFNANTYGLNPSLVFSSAIEIDYYSDDPPAYSANFTPASPIDPDTLLFWDNFHFSAYGQELLSDEANTALMNHPNIPEPATLALGGIGMLALRRRRSV